MTRSRRTALAAAALLPLLAGGFILQERSTRDGARLFDQVMMLVADRFVDTVGTGALYEKAARGLVEELKDPYTELLSPKDLQEFSRATNGNYGGVGMLIEDLEGHITVSKVFPNTPAEEAGIQEGDRIIQIDTVSTRGWKLNKVSETLIGRPGTRVNVRFGRTGVGEPIQVRFTRAIIHVPAVPYAIMLDGNIGYIPLQRFSETAADEIESAVQRLTKEGARGIVLDLRGNGGGILDESIAVSNLFLPAGKEVASVRGRGTRPQVYVTENKPVVPTTPVIVLTDGGSASASEIVAGALQDHDRALIVGTTSFGKGLVQTLYPLDGGYALKMTTAKWFTPSGRSIQKERKLVDGQFVEVQPDSLETDSVKKERPTFKSASGRTVYGGGAITPDVIVAEDTITTVEQEFVKSIAPKLQLVYTTLTGYAMELKPSVSRDFQVTAAWRDELYRRLDAAGVKVDRKQYDAAQGYVDNLLEQRVSRIAFGDSTSKRRTIDDDAPLRKAMQLLDKTQNQRDLFALAAREQQLSAAAVKAKLE
jgi:carboxyl-terminal processing protease